MTGEEIRELREAYGLSRNELAIKMMVTYRTIFRWENNQSKPLPVHRVTLNRMARRIKREEK